MYQLQLQRRGCSPLGMRGRQNSALLVHTTGVHELEVDSKFDAVCVCITVDPCLLKSQSGVGMVESECSCERCQATPPAGINTATMNELRAGQRS